LIERADDSAEGMSRANRGSHVNVNHIANESVSIKLVKERLGDYYLSLLLLNMVKEIDLVNSVS